ncbi:MAG: hypothetical protein ACTSO7_04785 [Candidatus Heimdallarchaeota archaeon]
MGETLDEDKIEIPQITIAKMLKLEENKAVTLSTNFLVALKPEVGDYAAIILTPNTKIIRIIPTTTDKVYKIAIDIGQLTPNFLKKIGNLFLSLGLKALYSTGLCFIEDKCVFDGYIDAEEFERIDVEELKKSILEVEGITGVDVSILEIE